MVNWVENVKFHIARLYMDEGVKFKGVFKKICDEKNILKYTFKKTEGSKRCLGVVECFNRTLCNYREVQYELQENLSQADLIPDVLDLYNRI